MCSELGSWHAVSGNTPKHTVKHTKHPRKHYLPHIKHSKNAAKHDMHGEWDIDVYIPMVDNNGFRWVQWDTMTASWT